MVRVVELRTAYHWFCEDCSGDNFETAVKSELTEEDKESVYRDFHQMDKWESLPEGWEQFYMVQIPTMVQYSHCGAEFSAIDEREPLRIVSLLQNICLFSRIPRVPVNLL